MGLLAGEATTIYHFYLPFQVSTLNGKNLLLEGSKFFPLRIDPNQRATSSNEAKRKSCKYK